MLLVMLTSLAFPLQDEKQAYVVTEVCYGGTLEDFLRVCPAHLNSLQLSSSACLHILHKNAVPWLWQRLSGAFAAIRQSCVCCRSLCVAVMHQHRCEIYPVVNQSTVLVGQQTLKHLGEVLGTAMEWCSVHVLPYTINTTSI